MKEKDTKKKLKTVEWRNATFENIVLRIYIYEGAFTNNTLDVSLKLLSHIISDCYPMDTDLDGEPSVYDYNADKERLSEIMNMETESIDGIATDVMKNLASLRYIIEPANSSKIKKDFCHGTFFEALHYNGNNGIECTLSPMMVRRMNAIALNSGINFTECAEIA